MGTKNKPGKFDCYSKAEVDEPLFVLLARDASAPDTIEAWIVQRMARGDAVDDPKLDEAQQCANAMREWRKKNRP